jgi:group II intron reverse transcriptase/maturase
MDKQRPNTESGNVNERRDIEELASKRARIAAKARTNPKDRFTNLIHHLAPELIVECLKGIPKNSAIGTDGITRDVALKNLSWVLPPILEDIHLERYDAPPVRRVYIPKADGSKRPLGIPQITDRAIQKGMNIVLNEIYEQDFLECSFGFRPNRGCHQALATIQELVINLGMTHALEVDIRDFFGSINHEWMMKFLDLRIGDERVLSLIKSWLKAGVMEVGKLEMESARESGTPQGGSISPLLANIYLHYVLDLWFVRKIAPGLKRKAALVRYADDFIILFQDENDLKEVQAVLGKRLDKFGLKVAEDKTHVTHLGANNEGRRKLTFLGFSIFKAMTVNKTGQKIVFSTDAKRFTRAKATIKEKMWKQMHEEPKKQAKVINAILTGHYNYYGMAGNSKRLVSFYYEVERYWRRCLSRRSQNGKMSWDELNNLRSKYPLRQPFIKIPYGSLKQYVRL